MASMSSTLPHSPSNNSFSSPLHTAPSTQAPSVISSRMTDIASEDGNEDSTNGANSAKSPATGTRTGHFPHEPNRPSSAMSSQSRSFTHSPNSRRGLPSPTNIGSWKSGGTFGGPGVAMSNTSRPQSAMSRTSKTHVPSLASHAFFRPMSSQRLQAQRSLRPSNFGQSIASLDGYSDVESRTNRQSIGSNATNQQASVGPQNYQMLPPSRGTEFTERDGHSIISPSPTVGATIHSLEGSEQPLRDQSSLSRLDYMKSAKYSQQTNSAIAPADKTSKPFRTNFGLPSHSVLSERNGASRHERLSSSNGSPRSANAKISSTLNQKAGSNYEYFSGNTVFCLGGRLQNTRDRPINIVSGILVALPSLLFFIYS
ncbi:MAG: hypothetical protein LQ342_001023 [Letrouitia transgressa]|nr:MAG: hypothetical protein LQ342_001023 [Letrouitia transgressa]